VQGRADLCQMLSPSSRATALQMDSQMIAHAPSLGARRFVFPGGYLHLGFHFREDCVFHAKAATDSR
jgi:hypothetical protein